MTSVVTAPRAANLVYKLALSARNKRPDRSTWLVPANACDAVLLALLSAHCNPALVDIEPRTLALSIDHVAERILTDASIAGVIHVSPYGSTQRTDMEINRLRSIIGEDRLLIDDRCLAVPAIEPEAVGVAADMVLYSTGARKVVDLGAGGYAFVRHGVHLDTPADQYDPSSHARLKAMLDTCERTGAGLPARTDPVFARLLRSWLPTAPTPDWPSLRRRVAEALPSVMAHKQMINSIYRTALPRALPFEEGLHNWRFNLRVTDPDAILRQIEAAGLFASRHYKVYRHSLGSDALPVAQALSASVLNLFNDHHFDAQRARQLADIVASR